MNITPALINPYPLVTEPDRSVTPVRATGRSRDALAHEERRHPAVESLTPVERERLETKAHTLLQPLDADLPKHAKKALTSYAAVSEHHERSDLHAMLGIDEYA